MNKLLKLLSNNNAVTSLLSKERDFSVQDSLSLSFLVAAAYQKKPQRIAIICPNLYSAQDVYEHLTSLISEDDCLFFPKDEILRMTTHTSSKEMLIQRLYVMEKTLDKGNYILITHVSAVTRYLPTKEDYLKAKLFFKVNEQYSLKEIVQQLVNNSFQKVNKIDSSLQFALRGDILDIFPGNLDKPVRIEFFDDEVESIRFFEIETQLSLESIDQVTIYPSTDLILSPSKIKEGILNLQDEFKKEASLLPPEAKTELTKTLNAALTEIAECGLNETLYKYYHYFETETVSILDYFKGEMTILFDKERIEHSYQFLIEESTQYYQELFSSGLSLYHTYLYQDYQELLFKTDNLIYTHLGDIKLNCPELKIRSVPTIASSLNHALEIIANYQEDGYKVIVALKTNQLEAFIDYLLDNSVPYEKVQAYDLPKEELGLTDLPIEEGFELIESKIVYLSSKEIYGVKHKSTKFIHRYKEAKILRSYEELEPGDYIVHEENGIGQFMEITNLKVGEVHKDFLKIKYAGKDVLYVPLEQFKLIRKFVSKEGAVPKINRLGGSEWEKTKIKIKQRINLIAERLIQLYAIRQSAKGFAFKKDDEIQNEFERAFPHPLTQDQIKAIEEIKADMEKPVPMDRLLCGDVGFGKTEVAFRAAFKAILSGKQVAILCPTTLLARQHFQRAQERFSHFGVKIALFSRFVPDSIQNKNIKEIKEEKIHLIIGTHRLLSSEIVIPSLGLLIVDEEQRFGVESKERIKEIANNIDVLTLTATPIPRTLQMSLLGIRSLSQLQQSPLNRMPIQTYVTPNNDSLVKEVIERELARNGQVFYLHNVTSTIHTKANRIQKLVPKATVGVVHGKMNKEDIEEVMMKFYNAEISILVCTSIIETGLDISNANTIIVEDADRFGLSQLYQIKGRVGRSNRIAYAYLLYNPQKDLNDVARKRLKAIKDFTELGSGYRIAQRDLTIRGAGDILGPEQAGFIDTVGIDMYIKLLNEVIKEKQGVFEKTREVLVSNLEVDGYIPKTYAEDGDKLELYQKIQDTDSIVSLDLLEKQIRDIYGKLPKEVTTLLLKRKVDILSSHVNIESFKIENNTAIIVLTPEISSINKIGIILFEQLDSLSKNVRLRFEQRKIKMKLSYSSTFLNDIIKLLTICSQLSK